MKLPKLLSLFALLLLACVGSAWAHGGRVGVYVGPYWGPSPWFYPAPYYYPYPRDIVVVPAEPPPVYIERQQEEAPAEPAVADKAGKASGYWYYCAGSKGYYPYVKECPGGWQKVLPHPEK